LIDNDLRHIRYSSTVALQILRTIIDCTVGKLQRIAKVSVVAATGTVAPALA